MPWKWVILNLDVGQVSEHSKCFEKPNYQGNHNDNIEDLFDLAIHWNERIDDPQKNTHNKDYN
nr:hypothetical protein [Sunxiuqinia indica]